MEDFALDFVFEFRPLLKYKRRKAVADEEVELFIPSLSELLVEPPEYKSPIPLGLTVELRISPAPCDDLAGICCVENVDSAELETGAAGRQLREFLPVPGLGGVWLRNAKAITAAERVLVYDVGMVVLDVGFLLTIVVVWVTLVIVWKWVGEVLSERPASAMIRYDMHNQ